MQNYCKEGEKERLTKKGYPLNSVIIVKESYLSFLEVVQYLMLCSFYYKSLFGSTHDKLVLIVSLYDGLT